MHPFVRTTQLDLVVDPGVEEPSARQQPGVVLAGLLRLGGCGGVDVQVPERLLEARGRVPGQRRGVVAGPRVQPSGAGVYEARQQYVQQGVAEPLSTVLRMDGERLDRRFTVFFHVNVAEGHQATVLNCDDREAGVVRRSSPCDVVEVGGVQEGDDTAVQPRSLVSGSVVADGRHGLDRDVS